jgi:hypothetical protein
MSYYIYQYILLDILDGQKYPMCSDLIYMQILLDLQLRVRDEDKWNPITDAISEIWDRNMLVISNIPFYTNRFN